MFCDLSYRQEKGALEGLEKDRETIFQRIRQRQGCEEKQALCLYTVGRRKRRYTKELATFCTSLQTFVSNNINVRSCGNNNIWKYWQLSLVSQCATYSSTSFSPWQISQHHLLFIYFYTYIEYMYSRSSSVRELWFQKPSWHWWDLWTCALSG